MYLESLNQKHALLEQETERNLVKEKVIVYWEPSPSYRSRILLKMFRSTFGVIHINVT